MKKFKTWFSSLSITAKYIITIVLIVIPFLLGALYTSSQNDNMDYYGISYNMVQTERIRTILIADLSQRLYDGNQESDFVKMTNATIMLQNELPIYEDTINSLMYGDESTGLPEATNEEIVNKLNTVLPMIETYVSNTEILMTDPTNTTIRDEIIDQTYEIDYELYQLAVLYEETYHVGYQSLSALNFMTILITIGFVLFALFLLRVLRRNEFHAIYDTLTKLRSRSALFDDIHDMSPENYNIIYMDIKNFKSINDVYGNVTGDEILVSFSNALKTHCLTKYIYRFAGEEFLILTTDQESKSIIASIENFKEQILQPFRDSKGRDHHINLSMGVVTSNIGIMNFEEKINLAIDLCYDSRNYKLKPMICDTHDKAIKHITMKNEILEAIQKDEIEPYFQPLFWRDGTIKGFESLARWNMHGELINPGSFLPMVNRSSMGFELDMKMIEEVGKACVKLLENSGEKHIQISINLAIDTIINIKVEDMIAKLETHGITSDNIIFEILEDVVISDKTRNKLKQIKSYGYQIALDDFTTGATSFEYLKFEEVDYVKIDKQVLRGLEQGTSSYEMLKDLIKMIHSAHKTVIVEGVEEKEELDMLHELGADVIQGYYYSKPLPLDKAIEFLSKNK